MKKVLKSNSMTNLNCGGFKRVKISSEELDKIVSNIMIKYSRKYNFDCTREDVEIFKKDKIRELTNDSEKFILKFGWYNEKFTKKEFYDAIKNKIKNIVKVHENQFFLRINYDKLAEKISTLFINDYKNRYEKIMFRKSKKSSGFFTC